MKIIYVTSFILVLVIFYTFLAVFFPQLDFYVAWEKSQVIEERYALL